MEGDGDAVGLQLRDGSGRSDAGGADGGDGGWW